MTLDIISKACIRRKYIIIPEIPNLYYKIIILSCFLPKCNFEIAKVLQNQTAFIVCVNGPQTPGIIHS